MSFSEEDLERWARRETDAIEGSTAYERGMLVSRLLRERRQAQARVAELEAQRERWEETVVTCSECAQLPKARARIRELEAALRYADKALRAIRRVTDAELPAWQLAGVALDAMRALRVERSDSASTPRAKQLVAHLNKCETAHNDAGNGIGVYVPLGLFEEVRAMLNGEPTPTGSVAPVPVVLVCPLCSQQHVDEGEWATRPHKTHRCVAGPFGKGCGHEWRPSRVATVGVRYADLAPTGITAR